jgi:type I restriction enzyme S subunit
MTGDVPRGWILAPLSQLGVWSSGGTPSRKNPDNFGGPVPWLKIGDLPDGPVLTTEESLTERGLAASSANWLPPNTLLVAMYGASIGKLGITTFRCTTNQAVAACIPHAGVDLRYLFAALALEKKRLIDKGQGGAQPNISQTILKVHEVPIAPANEQRRIVSKIDELFSRIDEGEAALARVEKLVERYRQSVLKAAVTGELTREWRAARKRAGEPVESGEVPLARILKARRAAWETAELAKLTAKGKLPTDDRWKQKYQEPAPPDTTDLPALPEGWVWASMEQLVSEFGNGLSRKPAECPPGLPILRISAVRSMSVDASDIRYYVQTSGEVLDGFKVLKGDLLFTRYNGSKALVGVSGVYEADRPVLHPDKLIKARVVKPSLVLPSFLAIACNAGEGWKHISSWVKTSAGQHGIAGSDIKRTPIPLPPRIEQERICALVERCSETSASMWAAGAAEARRSAALRQSILKAAFSGQLVPQDPHDEPAAKLLERIAAERVAAPAIRKRKKKSA